MKRLKANKEGKRLFTCTFCGAPQRMIISPGTMQVKCQYCGGLVLVPPWMGGKTLRCANHPERLAVGFCNDCGRNFCPVCLRIYDLETRDARATLYLDTACLRKRYAEKANKGIWVGILLLAYGIFSAFFSVGLGVVFIILASGMIAYSVLKGREKPAESTVDEVLMERERIEADPELRKSADAERLYDELLAKYVHRWGARTETVFLREEIRGYLRQGISFPEALQRIHARKRI
jgi:DNA-directed RNA polymerase subunit RPC12/RpoP